MLFQISVVVWVVFNLVIMVAAAGLGIYLLRLIIKALKVYINSHEVREKRPCADLWQRLCAKTGCAAK